MIGRQGVTDSTTAVALLVRFLAWNKQHRSAATQELYGRHILPFAEHIGEELLLAALKPHHVTAWIDARYAGCGANYRRIAIRSVQRAMNWAVREGHIPVSPLKTLAKPAQRPRDTVLAAGEWERIVAALADNDRPQNATTLDLLTFLRETGCRPQEARLIERRHLDSENRCLILERHESKGHSENKTVERRVIPLSDVAFELCQRLAARHPAGPLFRRHNGQAWTRASIGGRFTWLRKHGACEKGTSVYTLRHSFATEALERGVDPISVAVIMGHADTRQLMKTYQHLNKRGEHLRKALHQALGRPTAPAASQPV